MTWDNILVLLIVLAAVIYVIRRYRMGGGDNCKGCSCGCGTAVQPKKNATCCDMKKN